MIYIKSGDIYLKYHVTDDNRLICTDKNGTESLILTDVSNEFDAYKDMRGNTHFLLQGSSGELIYLKNEPDTWKKYSILKSRKGIKKIHSIRLIKNENYLCAFYIMEHDGNRLMIKHRFSENNLYEEPEVLGINDGKRNFSLCVCDSEYHLYYRDSENGTREFIMDDKFNIINTVSSRFNNEILAINTAYINKTIYAVCTVPKKMSTAMIFFDTKNEDKAKIITFGISRNCSPEIISAEGCIIIQWEENGSVMQTESYDLGESFSKPHLAGRQCVFADVRQNAKETPVFYGKCAIYNSIPNVSYNKNMQNNKAGINMNSSYKRSENHKFNEVSSEFITQKLQAIENDIGELGKTLDEMCKFLDRLTEFKNNIDNDFNITQKETSNTATLSGEDIGEIISDNVKLFENTDIDEILPDKENL